VDCDKISPNGSRDIAVKVHSSTSKVPFIIGRLQFNTSSLTQCTMCNSWCGVSENSLEMKQRYFPKIMCCLLLADDKLRPFVGNARAVTGVEFQENPSNSSRDRAVNILCSTN